MIKNHQFHPYYLTGFADAESCFYVRISRKKKSSTGWVVEGVFQIVLHKKDITLLERIKVFLGVGEIYKQGGDAYIYKVSSKKDLAVILDHFDKYPLLTQKRADFILFKRIMELMKNKEHLTKEGLRKIMEIRASINKGLSEEHKIAFPGIEPVERPIVPLRPIPDPNWFIGFTDGEGCFSVNITASKTLQVGYQVQLLFRISQHIRDAQLIGSFIEYLGCGRYAPVTGYNHGVFVVSGFTNILTKIIPLLKKYPLQSSAKDFEDFCKIAELIESKVHLTQEGLEQIRLIESRMNNARSNQP